MRLYETDDVKGHKTKAKTKFDHRAAVLACSFSADRILLSKSASMILRFIYLLIVISLDWT